MKKKLWAVGIGSFAVGVIAAGIIGFYSLPALMMLEDESPLAFDATIELFEQSVEDAGWSVLERHDMQRILAGHGHEVAPVVIFELCSARYSAAILGLDDERIVSPLMPCRVAIYEKSDGTVHISRMNSELMARPFGGIIDSVMRVAAVEIEEVIAQVVQ